MIASPRIFKVMRDTDVTGVSGAGHVADGVVFGDGTTVLRWRSEHRSTAVYSSYEDMVTIHGHDGATRFEFETRHPSLATGESPQLGVGVHELLRSTDFKNAVLKTVSDEMRDQMRRKPVI